MRFLIGCGRQVDWFAHAVFWTAVATSLLCLIGTALWAWSDANFQTTFRHYAYLLGYRPKPLQLLGDTWIYKECAWDRLGPRLLAGVILFVVATSSLLLAMLGSITGPRRMHREGTVVLLVVAWITLAVQQDRLFRSGVVSRVEQRLEDWAPLRQLLDDWPTVTRDEPVEAELAGFGDYYLSPRYPNRILFPSLRKPHARYRRTETPWYCVDRLPDGSIQTPIDPHWVYNLEVRREGNLPKSYQARYGRPQLTEAINLGNGWWLTRYH